MADDKTLKTQIDDLRLILEIEQENYKTALQTQLPHDTVKVLRENIKKLQGDLQVLLDRDSVQKTGDLPGGEVS